MHFKLGPRYQALPRIGGALLALKMAFLSAGQTPATYHNRADQAIQSFLLKFWNGGQQYLRQNFPSDGSLTGYWTYAHGWDAVMDAVERSGGQQYAGLIESFYLGQNERGWYSAYYDDECWMILALIHAFDLTGDSKYLNQAKTLYADVQTGWDTTCCGSTPGGVWWDKAHTQKATAANAGAALTGAILYQHTGDASYLAFAQQVYSFWRSNMVNPATFQVCDHFLPDGTKVWWKFTYNEGLMIGASVELYNATSNVTYLTTAHNIAGFMINNEVTPTAYGNVLYDGSNSGCGGDCHEFKGPAYRYLMRLYAKDTSKVQYYNVLKASVDAIWNLARNTNTTFSVNWAGPTQTNADELQMSAACIALNRFAQQYGNYPGSGIPPNRYEAENATLRHILLEATYGAFSGWGYVAGWNGNGQSIDFRVNCAVPGPRTLLFRYAGGAGNASRVVSINGVNAFPNRSFAGTGSWSTYATNSFTYNLPAGPSTISLIYNSALGSANYLNLDYLIVGDVAVPKITSISTSNSIVRLTWSAVTGQNYRVQFKDALSAATWSNLGGTITASGPTASANDSLGSSMRFYRVVSP